jgi:iron complex transport system ATP-binding protein
MIELRNITLGYDAAHVLLRDVSAHFTCGTTTALIGRNGTGKSTLLRAIIGSERLLQGQILIHGNDIQVITPQQLAQQVAFVTTERIRIANLACRDVVALGRAPYTNWIGRMQEADEAIVMQSLEQVGMADYAFRTMDKMSDGECQRVMIARALAQQTPIILLDEPTSFLDMPNRYELCHLLSDLAHQANKCIIFSTHELDIAQSICDTIALIDTPQMHHLPSDEMISSGHIDKLFTIRK